ncbi:MAG: DUF6557 family protein [Paludibacter sp.]
MKLSDLLKESKWDKVKSYLLHYYGAKENEIVFSEKSIEEYEKVYNSLFHLEVAQSEMRIWIKFDTYDDDDENYPRVYATDTTLRENSTELEHFDITPVPWKEWLGMEISDKTAKELDLNEIVALCLNEMTFTGFDEDAIQKYWDNLFKESVELKNMTPEELKEHTFTLDDLRKELGLDL